MSRARSAISLQVSALIVILLIIIVGFGAYLSTTSDTTSTTSISKTSVSSSSSSYGSTSHLTSSSFAVQLNAICLDEMPANATIIGFENSTYIGYRVSLPNGTDSYFQLGGCPSPVSPRLFTVAAEIEQNFSFIAAEKNYTYVVDPIGSLNAGGTVMASGTTPLSFTVVDFGYYSNQRIYPCGGTYWTLLELGRIQVDLPIDQNGSYDFSDIRIISSFSSNGVQFFSCTTQATTIPTHVQTTTISSETCTAAATLNQTSITETLTLSL